jgi:hypothetical protein
VFQLHGEQIIPVWLSKARTIRSLAKLKDWRDSRKRIGVIDQCQIEGV